MEQPKQDDLTVLIMDGKEILALLEQKLQQPGALDVLRIGSPFLLSEEEAGKVERAVDEYKSATGLAPVRDVLGRYVDWGVRCDTVFTRNRWRSDPRAKEFIRIGRNVERFSERRISVDSFLLGVRKQVSLIESLVSKPRPRKSPTRKTEGQQKQPEDKRIDFIVRKGVQGVLLALVVSVATLIASMSWAAASLSLVGTIAGFFAGLVFQAIHYIYSNNEKPLGRLGGYLLLAGYAMSFLAITTLYTPDLHSRFGYMTDILLIAMLVISEAATRWGTIQQYVSVMEHIQSMVMLGAIVLVAYIVSVVIAQPIWIGFGIVGFFLAVWTKVKPGSSNK